MEEDSEIEKIYNEDEIDNLMKETSNLLNR